MSAHDPFAGLDRGQLAVLTREYLLAGHLIDRAGMPQVVAEFGRDEMRDVAIEEWMGASPVYTRRVQQALAFSGDDVATIFKGMQLDIGAPHQFMDFRYEVRDRDHGEFWLASCGALMDVEPIGEDFVVAMCHHIEDPTFDATATATNPRARVRPIHRPPRQPADRHPHCHWRVFIDHDAEPLAVPEAAVRVAASRAAHVVIERPDLPGAGEGEGRGDYSGAFDPEFQLRDLSRSTLHVAAREVCLQGHLLAHAFMCVLARRHGDDVTRRITTKQLIGIGGVAARRLADLLPALGDPPTGLDAVVRVLDLHPAFHPRSYVDFRVERDGDRLVASLGDCDALDENDGWSWAALLTAGQGEVFDAIVQRVDARARSSPVEPPRGRRAAWAIEIEPRGALAEEPAEVTLTRFSTGADFVFRD